MAALIATAVWTINTTDTPAKAAARQVHHDRAELARQITVVVLQHSPMRNQIAEEISDAIAEQDLPKTCTSRPATDTHPLILSCAIITLAAIPHDAIIYAPITVTLRVDRTARLRRHQYLVDLITLHIHQVQIIAVSGDPTT